MGPFETIYIDEMVAACNGGGGPLGHPRVYLNLAPDGRVECPYCSRLFVNPAMPSRTIGESVVTPSAHEPGGERGSESPAPRQPPAPGAGPGSSG
ncbi:MAG: zinc-finger domain-containing protein [Alphaproteobacteria bacterium]|nr:zinc-finger domain-containing protein [Alphaproteobacteria bacterium]